MNITIIKENTVNPHAWYNEIKPRTYKCIRGNGKIEEISDKGVRSKIGKSYKVEEYDENNFITAEIVFGNSCMLIRKEDTQHTND